jgi:hypothetical protein
VKHLLQPGQVWQSRFTRQRYKVLAVEANGVKVECMDAVFPHPTTALLHPAMFSPEAMVPEEQAVEEDFERYWQRLAGE